MFIPFPYVQSSMGYSSNKIAMERMSLGSVVVNNYVEKHDSIFLNVGGIASFTIDPENPQRTIVGMADGKRYTLLIDPTTFAATLVAQTGYPWFGE